MSLRRDERARVPFAVIGIVLLLGSAALTLGLQPDRPATDPPVDDVMDRTVATTQTELRTAIVSASVDAARRPVLLTAATDAGRVLDESDSFRDALRIRIYLRARDRLDGMEVEHRGIQGTASLPPTPTASSLRDANGRVRISAANANRTKLRVRIENVSVTAYRGNRTVGHREISPTLVVDTPVLALHNRVDTFDERLNHGLGKPGLSQRLTSRLYALTWTRGYAQWGSGGEAITNVVANRHVELMTNDALLREQQAVFGRSDAAGRRTMAHAIAGVGVTDLLAEARFDAEWLDTLFRGGPPGTNIPSKIPALDTSGQGPKPGDKLRVYPNRTTDRAFAYATNEANLTDTLQSVYSADARVTFQIRDYDQKTPHCSIKRPDGNWVLRNWTAESSDWEISTVDSNWSPSVGGNWHDIAHAGRVVELNVTRTCIWQSKKEKKTTEVTGESKYTIDLALVGRHAHSQYVPEQGIGTYQSGQYGGLDLDALHRNVHSEVVIGRGGWDRLAKRAANDRLDESIEVVAVDIPDGVRQQARSDMSHTKARIENVSITVRRGRAGTFQANPAGELRRKLYQQRESILFVPDEYQTVGHKARIAARGALLDETREQLRIRRSRRWDRRNNLGKVLAEAGAGSVSLFQTALRNRSGVSESNNPTDGGVNVTAVDGSPAYLTTAEIDDEYAESIPDNRTLYPLAAKNVNVFTFPHGDIVDTLLSSIDLGKKVRFRTAARTLAGLESGTTAVDDSTLESRLDKQRSKLEPAVQRKLEHIKQTAMTAALAESGVGKNDAERQKIIDAGFSKWKTTGAQALAVTNGSAAQAVTNAAVDGNQTRENLLEARLRAKLYAAQRSKQTRIARNKVSEVSTAMRDNLSQALNEEIESGIKNGSGRVGDRIEKRLGRSINRVPAGFPIMPVGPSWWVTTNLWYVAVKGGYERFAVRTRTGSADEPGEALTYVRDDTPVTLDFDDDGTAERFGRSERLSFTARTAVAIVVPAGAQGVGDKDGNMDERSSGWTVWAPVNTSTAGQGEESEVPVTWPSEAT